MSDTDDTPQENADTTPVEHTDTADAVEVSEAVKDATPSKRELDAMSPAELRAHLDALPDRVAEAVKSVIPKAPRPQRVEKVAEAKVGDAQVEQVKEPEAPKRKGGRLAGWYTR